MMPVPRYAGLIEMNTEQGVAQDGLVAKIAKAIKLNNLDICVGPEWMLLPPRNSALPTAAEKDNVIDELIERTKTLDCLIIPGTIMWRGDSLFYNAAPVIYGGKLIGMQYKKRDGGDTYNAEKRGCKKPMYQQGGVNILSWKDRRLGIDICADFNNVGLKLTAQKEQLLDLYFLVSCGMALGQNSYVPLKPKGIAMCCDADNSSVMRKPFYKRDSLIPIPCSYQRDINAMPLSIYDLETEV